MVIIVRKVERQPTLAETLLREQKEELLDKLRTNGRFLHEAEENLAQLRSDREDLKHKLHLVCVALHQLDLKEERDGKPGKS